MAAAKNPRIFKFGPDDSLIGSITAPAKSGSKIGAIIWGMGIPQVQAARRFAKQGIASMQIRIGTQDFYDFQRRNSIYDSSGVAHCRAAMDKLASEQGLNNFLMMGNCAHANLCFNTALVDKRAVGLILTNPHFSEIQILSTAFHRKLFRWSTWKRLMQGKTNLRGNLLWMGPILREKLRDTNKNAAAKSLLSAYHYRADAILPPDFDEKLAQLCSRGIQTLIIYSHTEDSLRYLRKTYQENIDRLSASGQLRIEVLAVDSHAFFKDHAAGLLIECISDWTQNKFSQNAHIAMPYDGDAIATSHLVGN